MDSTFNSKANRAVAGIAVAAATALIIGSQLSFAAVVGTSRVISLPQAADATLDTLRSAYRRPQSIPFPKENPYTTAKAELGKKLYFETRLSASGSQSCASCHNPGLAWGDGLARGVGHNMGVLGRRSPTIINGAFGQIFMWDSRFASLEEQAIGPILSGAEMNLTADEAITRIKGIPQYKSLFEAAFPKEDISLKAIGMAIATFERSVVSDTAPFDRWIEGDDSAISESAKKGFVLFNTKANCAACHSGWNFTDDSSHDIGLPSADIGRGKFLPDVDKLQFAFKTPGLREITRRAPYMHDGSLLTLDAVIEHYDHAGLNRPSRSDAIQPLKLTAQDRTDLLAFLSSISADSAPTVIPSLPR